MYYIVHFKLIMHFSLECIEENNTSYPLNTFSERVYEHLCCLYFKTIRVLFSRGFRFIGKYRSIRTDLSPSPMFLKKINIIYM